MTAAAGDAGRPAASARPALVVDASVAAKWLLKDEADTAAADRLLDQHDDEQLVLVAPQQIEVEVTATIRKAALAGRITRAQADTLAEEWIERLCPRLHLLGNGLFLRLALRRSFDLGVTLFDALYITLAEHLAADLVVADERLLASAAGGLPYLRHVRDSGPRGPIAPT